MEFFKCSIGGEIYGTGMTEIEMGGAKQNGGKVGVTFCSYFIQKMVCIFCVGYNFDTINIQVPKSANAIHEKGFNFYDDRLMRGAWRNEPNPDACKVGFCLRA